MTEFSVKPSVTDWALSHLDSRDQNHAGDEHEISKAKTKFLANANASSFHVSDRQIRSVMVLCGDSTITKQIQNEINETTELEDIQNLIVEGFSNDFDRIIARLTWLSANGSTARVKKRAAHALRSASCCHQPLNDCSPIQRSLIEAFAIVAVAAPTDKHHVRNLQIERIQNLDLGDPKAEAGFMERYPNLIELDKTLHRTLSLNQTEPQFLPSTNQGLVSSILDRNESSRLVSRDSNTGSPNSSFTERQNEAGSGSITGWHIFIAIWLIGVVAKLITGFSGSTESKPIRPSYFPSQSSSDAFPNRKIKPVPNSKYDGYTLEELKQAYELLKERGLDDDPNSERSRFFDQIKSPDDSGLSGGKVKPDRLVIPRPDFGSQKRDSKKQ